MSGRALHRRSNPTRQASGSGRGGDPFARKGSRFEKPSMFSGEALSPSVRRWGGHPYGDEGGVSIVR